MSIFNAVASLIIAAPYWSLFIAPFGDRDAADADGGLVARLALHALLQAHLPPRRRAGHVPVPKRFVLRARPYGGGACSGRALVLLGGELGGDLLEAEALCEVAQVQLAHVDEALDRFEALAEAREGGKKKSIA